jgi:hypothetical protein
MTPRRYTHLFFLDEATAFAAGHRPCAECRRTDYEAFRRCWASASGIVTADLSTGLDGAPTPERPGLPSADAMDAVLHRERSLVDGRRRTRPAVAADLPDGTFVVLDDNAWLLRGGSLWRWTPGGYHGRRPVPPGPLAVLTPPSTVDALRSGYRSTSIVGDLDDAGRGYGAGTLDAVVHYLGARPGADVLYTSCADGPGSPRGFYLRYGFTDTGRIMWGENVLALDVTKPPADRTCEALAYWRSTGRSGPGSSS